jgi:hypothetical protein
MEDADWYLIVPADQFPAIFDIHKFTNPCCQVAQATKLCAWHLLHQH